MCTTRRWSRPRTSAAQLVVRPRGWLVIKIFSKEGLPTVKLSGIVFIVLTLVGISQVYAGISTFTDRSQFIAEAGSLNQESFENLTATNTNALTSISTNGFTIAANGSYLGVFNRPETGAHATDGTNYVIAFNPTGGFTLTWDFGSAINAFGFDITDFESGSTRPLTLNYVGGTFISASSSANGSEEFFGLIDTGRTFTQFELSSPSPNASDGIGLDRIAHGTAAVPEPNSLVLSLIGLLGMVVVVGRIRSQKSP